MEILVIDGYQKKITLDQLKEISEDFGGLVKAVVDIEKRIMAIGGELHSDEEAFLLERDSQQRNLWGINLYPELEGEEFIEFDSVINLRPMYGNRTRQIEDENIREKIKEIINSSILT